MPIASNFQNTSPLFHPFRHAFHLFPDRRRADLPAVFPESEKMPFIVCPKFVGGTGTPHIISGRHDTAGQSLIAFLKANYIVSLPTMHRYLQSRCSASIALSVSTPVAANCSLACSYCANIFFLCPCFPSFLCIKAACGIPSRKLPCYFYPALLAAFFTNSFN